MIEQSQLDDSIYSLDESQQYANTQSHMNKINIERGNEIEYRCLNLKRQQSVDYEKDIQYNIEVIDDDQSQQLNHIDYFQANMLENSQPQCQEIVLGIENLESLTKNDSYLSDCIFNPLNQKRISQQNIFQCRLQIQKRNPVQELQNSDQSFQNRMSILQKSTDIVAVNERDDISIDNKSTAKNEIISLRLIKAINLLVNVKNFYKQLSKNSRLFEKFTQKQHSLIGDITSSYSKHKRNKLNRLMNRLILNQIIFLVNMIQYLLKFLLSKIKLIQPNHPIKRIWDSMQAIFIVYFIYIISLIIFFQLSTDDYQLIFTYGFIFFLVDIVFTFNTGIIEKGSLINKRQNIAIKYLKGNFIFDLLGLVPFMIECFQLTDSENIFLKIAFGFIIFKIFLLLDILEQLSFFLSFQKNKKNLVDLIKVIFLIISVCHFFSIFWHGLALYEINTLHRDDTWINNLNLLDADIHIRYIYSFYFLAVTMQTVGYGDITPKNPIEIMFTVITMFCTGMIWAFSLNSIGNIIENINKTNKDYKNEMKIIHSFMREELIDYNLRGKVSNYLEYLHKESNETQKKKEKKIIQKLSKQLQQEIAIQVQGKFLNEIPIIRNFISQKTQQKLIPYIEEILFSPGEIIFKQQDIDDNALYYIVKGSVLLLFESKTSEKKDHIFQELFKKQYFGEISFITGQIRGATARASDFCRLFKIKRESFLEIVKKESEDYQNFQMVKESVSLKENLKTASIRCYQCNQGDHLSIKCPKTQMILSKQIIFTKHNFSIPIKERTKMQRRETQKSFRTLSKMNYIQEIIFYIINNPDHQQYIQELEKNFFKVEDDEQEDYKSTSSSQLTSSSSSDSDEDSQNQTKQSAYTSVKDNESDAFGTQHNIQRPSILYGQQRINQRMVQSESKSNLPKEKNLFHNLIPRQSSLEHDMDQSNQNYKKTSATYIPQSITQLNFDQQQQNSQVQIRRGSFQQNQSQSNQIQGQRNSFAINSGLLNSINHRNLQRNSIQYEEILNEDKKYFMAQMPQIIDKSQATSPLKNKEKRKSSQLNKQKTTQQKDRKKQNEFAIKQKPKLNQRLKMDQRKSVAFSQISSILAFQQTNNINPMNNVNKEFMNQSTTFGHSTTIGLQKQISSSHNYHKLFTTQTTQNDQKPLHQISIEEMNKKFDKLFNFKVYYPHNNSSEVIEKYSVIVQKNIDKLVSKQLISNKQKQPKKINQQKNILGFNKELALLSNIGTPRSKPRQATEISVMRNFSQLAQSENQSMKNLQLLSEK